MQQGKAETSFAKYSVSASDGITHLNDVINKSPRELPGEPMVWFLCFHCPEGLNSSFGQGTNILQAAWHVKKKKKKKITKTLCHSPTGLIDPNVA